MLLISSLYGLLWLFKEIPDTPRKSVIKFHTTSGISMLVATEENIFN